MSTDLPKCWRCGESLRDHRCSRCNIIYCPFCHRPENDENCGHLIGNNHSPTFRERLPFIDVEFDSPMLLLPIDYETIFGDLSPLMDAYAEDIFSPPDPRRLFESLTGLIATPHIRISQRIGVMTGRHIFFAADQIAAIAEMDSILLQLSCRISELDLK